MGCIAELRAAVEKTRRGALICFLLTPMDNVMTEAVQSVIEVGLIVSATFGMLPNVMYL